MRYDITNLGKGRLQVRDSERGLVPLMPGASGDFELPRSLALYYKSAGATVVPDPEAEEPAPDSGPAKVELADLPPDERVKLAAAEGIALGDIDPASDDAVALINEFRRLYASGTDKDLRDKFGGEVDFIGAKTKGDVVNAIIAARGVGAA